MEWLRECINEGLSQRASAGVKVRQPLQSVSIYDDNDRLTDDLKEIIAEELNVKKVETRKNPEFDTDQPFLEAYLQKVSTNPVTVVNMEITSELKREGIMREVIRAVQNARKQAGLQVDDHIKLSLSTESSEVMQAIEEHKQVIIDETLAAGLLDASQAYSYAVDAKVEGESLHIELEVS